MSTVALADDKPAPSPQGNAAGTTTAAGPGKPSAQGAGDAYLAREF